MKNILVLGFVLASWFGFSQNDSIHLIFEITDVTYNEPIQNVNATLSFGNSSVFKQSSTKGLIHISIPAITTINYSFSHPIYESVLGSKKIQGKSNGDTLRIQIELKPSNVHILKDVVVKAPGIPDTVFESKRLSVADFEIQKDGKLILLAYPKQLKKGSELLLYDGVEIINSFTVPGVAEELTRDYRGNAHVICQDNVYGIFCNDQNVSISNLQKEYFMKYVAPIVDTTKIKLFFSNFSKDYPAFDYYSVDQIDSTYSKIIHIEDKLMMELYRSEYKWMDVRTKLWAKNKEIETGIDAEVWIGANYFTQSIYYKELYAPLFSKNDTVYVFDYYKDKLFSFDSLGNNLDSVPIYHHYQPKATGWQKNVIQDRGTGEIYGVFEKSGYTYLGLINMETGDITEKIRLTFRYIDKIAIHDNFVYYVYRPYESNQKKFLYKERLPYNFGSAKVPYGTEISIETGK